MPATYTTPGLVLREHELAVPLDHTGGDGGQITLFAREVAHPDGANRPFLLYLQGGPGFEAPRPTGNPTGPGWLERALKDFRVLLLDQRGTGRSTPVGDLAGMDPEAQARYLTHFRADSIVRDCEALRAHLGSEPWSVLGQSFGGLCVTTYLSLAPEGLREALVTGGLPPLGEHVDDVYRATFARAVDRSHAFYARYPEDRDRVLALLARLEVEALALPDGDRLTAWRLRTLGQELGMSDGAEVLHYILELDPDTTAFRHDVAEAMPFARNPLYAVLHEACWADGGSTGWSADRMLPGDYEDEPELLGGEHVHRWMFAEVGALRPLADAADLLAVHEWPRLYDPARLAANTVPVAAAVYANDMYVERAFSEDTAAQMGACRVWLTSEYEHNGLRAGGGHVLGRLLDMVRGRA